MSSVLEKFGIYDFWGIWGPGAITVTYYFVTLYDKVKILFGWLQIGFPNISKLHVLVILYSAVAYLVGVLLHEIGKVLADRSIMFDCNAVQNIAHNGEIPSRGFGWRIKKEHKRIVESTIPEQDYKMMYFDKSMAEIKYRPDVSTNGVDKYHSIYALSRSLLLCFLFHLIIEAAVLIVENSGGRVTLLIMGIDAVMVLFFLGRTYRYFCSWIRNTFIQHYISTTATSTGGSEGEGQHEAY